MSLTTQSVPSHTLFRIRRDNIKSRYTVAVSYNGTHYTIVIPSYYSHKEVMEFLFLTISVYNFKENNFYEKGLTL